MLHVPAAAAAAGTCSTGHRPGNFKFSFIHRLLKKNKYSSSFSFSRPCIRKATAVAAVCARHAAAATRQWTSRRGHGRRGSREPPAVAVGVPRGDLELYASVTPPPRRPSLSRPLMARLKHLSSQPRHRLQPLLVHGSTGPANAGKARSLSSSHWEKKKQSWSLCC